MNRRRRIRRRPSPYRGKKIQVNFVPVIVIICLSVCAGYLTAKYVVYPVLGYEPAGLQIFEQKDSTKAEKEQEDAGTKGTGSSEETTQTAASAAAEEGESAASAAVIGDQERTQKETGYAIQFGSYSTKAAAEKSVSQLKQSGITAEVVEKDGAYKVISKLFATKDKAKSELKKMDESIGAFVTAIEE